VHNHALPDGWLAHAELDDHYLDLGSWYDMEIPVLCIQSDEVPLGAESTSEADTSPQTPESPPTFALRFHANYPCGEWPNYAAFEVESTSIWILQSAHFEIFDNTNNQSIYNGNNDRPFLKENECPPGDTILPPFNTRYLAANLQEPEAGTNFSAAITLCTEDNIQGECVTEVIDFVFEGQEIPFAGTWKNEPTGMTLEISETALVKRFAYQGAMREIHYTIVSYDAAEGHIDLLTERVIQAGEEVEYDWAPAQYLSYTITDDVMKMFIGPNPYPVAASGVSYTRQGAVPQEEAQPPEDEPSFEAAFAGTHPCGNWPHYAAFQIENTSSHTFESVSLIINDITNDTHIYGGSNDRGFVNTAGCPPGDSALPPNSTAQVAANIREPESGTEFEAILKLCTQDSVEGECVSQKVYFTFEE